MADEMWWTTIGNRIYTILKKRLTSALSEKYPTLKVGTTDKDSGDYKAPYVYLQELTPVERGQTLDNSGVHAVMETIQITVTTDTSLADAMAIANECVRQFKHMRFNVSAMPIPTTRKDGYHAVCRFRRIIGADDDLAK